LQRRSVVEECGADLMYQGVPANCFTTVLAMKQTVGYTSIFSNELF